MKRIIAMVSLGFIGGVLVGGSVVFFFMRSILEKSQSISAAAKSVMPLAALYPLRGGDTNTAVSRLETILDGNILVLGTIPQTEIVTGCLSTVKEYRTKYPYKSGDKGIDATVQHILSGVEAR